MLYLVLIGASSSYFPLPILLPLQGQVQVSALLRLGWIQMHRGLNRRHKSNVILEF